jgi:hypothetical protein
MSLIDSNFFFILYSIKFNLHPRLISVLFKKNPFDSRNEPVPRRCIQFLYLVQVQPLHFGQVTDSASVLRRFLREANVRDHARSLSVLQIHTRRDGDIARRIHDRIDRSEGIMGQVFGSSHQQPHNRFRKHFGTNTISTLFLLLYQN